ncbi:MAG: YbjQ family protein [Rikenellaceae bacterium]
MNYSILVTTTNSFQGLEILKYVNLVSTNIVVGTNFFSDFGASFTDLFGGYSDTYQRKLQGIYKSAIDNLKQQAASQGCNAIVGLKIDFDEISGKGKSMFMVSAVGMAVKLKQEEIALEENSEKDFIDLKELSNEIMRRHIIKDIKSGKLPTKDQLDYMLQNPINEVIEDILNLYIRSDVNSSENEQLLFDNIENLILVTDKEQTSCVLYKKLQESWNYIYPIIDTIKYFSPQLVLEMINDNYSGSAIQCLSIDKETYDKSDLYVMKLIVDALDKLPETGSVEPVKGTFSKAKDKFICENGHKNNMDSGYCCECGVNIYGLRSQEVAEIDLFKEKVAVLESLLSM